MTKELDGGITRNGEGFDGVALNILGQTYYPKAWCESTFAFETNSEPGQHVPVHIHSTQDEFILVQEGELALKLDGEWSTAGPGVSSPLAPGGSSGRVSGRVARVVARPR